MAQSIGGRIADLRRRRGLTQQDLAEAVPLSYSYISLIEAGKRNPRRKVIALIAEQLGCSEEYLETGRGVSDVRALELDLRFAELALRSGDAASAKERFHSVLATATQLGEPYNAEALEARWGLVRCHLRLGELHDSLRHCQHIADAATLPPTLTRAMVLMILSRCYLECGDVNRAIDVGEEALRELRSSPDSVEPHERSELRATVALCYYERGDLERAQLLLDDVIAECAAVGSVVGKAAAYWNAALVAEARGDLTAACALTDRALAVYGEEGKAQSAAVLKANTAALLLQLPGRDVAQAERMLVAALEELRELGAPAMWIASTQTDLARCRLRLGDPASAAALASAALSDDSAEVPLEAARTRIVLVEALLALGDADEALRTLGRALSGLGTAGFPQRAKGVLCSLGEALLRAGLTDEALAVFRRLAVPWSCSVPSLPAEPETVSRHHAT